MRPHQSNGLDFIRSELDTTRWCRLAPARHQGQPGLAFPSTH